MDHVIPEFLRPRLVGERFENHSIPLEILKDLAVLEELIVEVAKWHYLEEHSGRQRVPRGFTDGVSLRLTSVDEGSAIPIIALCLATVSPQLFPPPSQPFFEMARNSVVEAIAAAGERTPVAVRFPEGALSYFDRIGRNLRKGESLEFALPGGRVASLNQATRRALVLSSPQVQYVTEAVTLRGFVPEASQDKQTFTLVLADGNRVPAPLLPEHWESVRKAFNDYRLGVKVQLQGIGRFSRSNRLQAIEIVEHVGVLDANDVPARLDDFRLLKDGWLEGQGIAPRASGLDWLTTAFEHYYPDYLPLPYLYPTPEGGVQAEWPLNGNEASLEIDLEQQLGDWHNLNTDSQEVTEFSLNLGTEEGWTALRQAVETLSFGGSGI